MEKAERKSSIELLKIIGMFLICISHIVNVIVYGGVFPKFSTDFYNILFTVCKYSGWVGDFIFITSTAYFIAENKNFHFRKIILYYLDVVFVFLVYLGVFSLAKVSIPKDVLILTLTTGIVFEYWYILHYLIFLLLLPFVNRIIAKFSQKTHKIATVISVIIGFIFLALSYFDISVSAIKFMLFINTLIIVSYGKKYGRYLFFKERDTLGNLLGLIVAFIIIVGKTILINAFDGFGFIPKSTTSCDLIDPIWYVVGITLFLLFKDMNIKNSKFINYISSLSLIFYVSHHNKYTSLIYDNHFRSLIGTYSKPYWFLFYIAFGILRFIYGIIVSIIFKETIHRGLQLLTSIKFKKKNKEIEVKE